MRKFNFALSAIACGMGITFPALGKDCDSELNAHLIKQNGNVSANAEVVFGTFLSNLTGPDKVNYVPMVNFAADIGMSDHSSIFFNGALKYKVAGESEEEKTEEDKGPGKGAQVDSWRLALRELHYENITDALRYKLGFMTYTLQNQLLLDERALGFDVVKKGKLFNTRVFGAGLMDPFAREKQTCVSKSTRRPEDEVAKASSETEGEGEERGAGRNFAISKHFAGIQLDFSTDNRSEPVAATEDEFKATTSAEANESPTRYGVQYFVEAKDDLKTFKHYPGAFLSTSVATVDIAAETALQIANGDATLGYVGKFYRTFLSENASIYKVFGGYTAFNPMRGDADFAPSYSNMLLSDVNQYLTKENNVAFYGMSYKPNSAFLYQISNYHKMFGNNSSELDASLTYYYYEYSKIKLGGNWLYGKVYEPQKYQAYAEVRHIF